MIIENRQFEIHKPLYGYLVIVQGMNVVVKPLQTKKYIQTNFAVANILQTLGNSTILINRPLDPFNSLQQFFEEKGWVVKNPV